MNKIHIPCTWKIPAIKAIVGIWVSYPINKGSLMMWPQKWKVCAFLNQIHERVHEYWEDGRMNGYEYSGKMWAVEEDVWNSKCRFTLSHHISVLLIFLPCFRMDLSGWVRNDDKPVGVNRSIWLQGSNTVLTERWCDVIVWIDLKMEVTMWANWWWLFRHQRNVGNSCVSNLC